MSWVPPPLARQLLSITFLILSLFTASVGAQELERDALLQALKQGGLVVYFRHAATLKDQIDERPIDLSQCQKQRNLSPQGQQDARKIGKAFVAAGIAVTEVISSPFCRCKDTAQLAFQRFETNPNLFFSIGLEKTERDEKTAVLQELLSTPVKSGNRILISHTSNLKEATGIWPKAEGGAYLFKPQGAQQFEYLGKLLPSDWNGLK